MALVQSSPAASAPLSTQGTANISEFRCLFTLDIRRKAKRWQDGLLRLHSFNKRVMVYDDRRNKIGDTYWKGEEELGDGSELELEMGALVEVGESIIQVQQSRQEILKAVQGKGDVAPRSSTAVRPQAKAASALSRPLPMASELSATRGIVLGSSSPPAALPKVSTPESSLLIPRTLNELLGPSRGAIGRAHIPKESPFAVRQRLLAEKQAQEIPAPAPKRRKIADNSVQGSTRREPALSIQNSPDTPVPSPTVARPPTLQRPIDLSAQPDANPEAASDTSEPAKKSARATKKAPRVRKGGKTADVELDIPSLPELAQVRVEKRQSPVIELDSDEAPLTFGPTIQAKAVAPSKTKSPGKETRPKKKRKKKIETPRAATEDEATPSLPPLPEDVDDRPVNIIRMVPKASRPKLMCQNLGRRAPGSSGNDTSLEKAPTKRRKANPKTTSGKTAAEKNDKGKAVSSRPNTRPVPLARRRQMPLPPGQAINHVSEDESDESNVFGELRKTNFDLAPGRLPPYPRKDDGVAVPSSPTSPQRPHISRPKTPPLPLSGPVPMAAESSPLSPASHMPSPAPSEPEPEANPPLPKDNAPPRPLSPRNNTPSPPSPPAFIRPALPAPVPRTTGLISAALPPSLRPGPPLPTITTTTTTTTRPLLNPPSDSVFKRPSLSAITRPTIASSTGNGPSTVQRPSSFKPPKRVHSPIIDPLRSGKTPAAIDVNDGKDGEPAEIVTLRCVVDGERGAWSREARDLFEWRPPGFP